MKTVYIGLGSNLNQPWCRLAQGLSLISRISGVRMLACSRVYRSQPMGPKQPDFLNAVCRIAVERCPDGLLTALQAIERQQGRLLKRVHWGPRPLDLDILWWQGCVMQSSRLTLPHPGCWQRLFVLFPWLDVCQHDPELKQRVHAGALSSHSNLLGPGRFISGWLQ